MLVDDSLEPQTVHEPSQYLQAVSSLAMPELLMLYRRRANAEPPTGAKAREEILAWFGQQQPPEDHDRLIGEIKELSQQLGTGTEDEAGVTQPLTVSWRPDQWSAAMSQGPQKGDSPLERKRRFGWAKALLAERESNRRRLEGMAGIGYRFFNAEKNNYESGDEGEEAWLSVRTEKSNTTLAALGEKFDISVDFLVAMNRPAYKNIKADSKLLAGTVIILEDEVPEDMIDEMNAEADS